MRINLSTLFLLSALCLSGCKPEGPNDIEPDPVAEDEETETGSDSLGSTTSNFVPEDVIVEGECDPWLQDCLEGEKCVPYSKGGGPWDANKCVPIDGDGQPGDSCTYDGIALASDSCGADSHCWDVQEIDGELIGKCTPFCTGTANDPICGPDTSCLMANDGAINLCVQTCDPLLQACDEGLACYWANNDFNCIFTTEDIAEAEPCGFVNDCAPGNFCAVADVLPACDGPSCCTGYCDLSDPFCAVEGTECTAFFDEGLAAPGYEDVGVCIAPG